MATQLNTTAVPDFQLEDQNGKIFDVRKFVGKKILLIYFYPKDESAVCTKEACAFRDSYSDYIDAGAMVIGRRDPASIQGQLKATKLLHSTTDSLLLF